jgi:hypothetical protein
VSGTEGSNEERYGCPHLTWVSEGRSSGWLSRHEPSLLVSLDIRAAVSDPTRQLEIGRTAALGSLIRQCPA